MQSGEISKICIPNTEIATIAMNNITCKIRELLQKFFSDYAQPQSLYMYTCNLVAIIDHQSTLNNGDGSFWRFELNQCGQVCSWGEGSTERWGSSEG